MTDEVGVVTGELTVAAEELPDGGVAVTVQYAGAEEWYTVTGSPVPARPEGLAAVHEEMLARVRRGGGATVRG
ncbi:hypothetical protein RCO28_09155 [Streptomyces sp. LHD-70]|nr:hypothetical protein [Streptomyces sp. LHD-70]MDQ8702654.1 hypothetical protein [Streptomyces sp. LHD-70]